MLMKRNNSKKLWIPCIFNIVVAALLWITTAASAMAFDVSYYQMTAKSYLEDGDRAKAADVICEGLAKFPKDPELQRLNAEIRKNAASKEAEQIAKKDREQKQRDELKKANEPNFLKMSYCACRKTQKRAQHDVDDEKRIEIASGVFNRSVLYENGKLLVQLQKIFEHMNQESKRLNITLDDCSGVNIQVGYEELQCDNYYRANFKQIEKGD